MAIDLTRDSKVRFRRPAKDLGINVSLLRTNADLSDNQRSFTTRVEAEQGIFENIEGYYNRVRLYSSINHVSPAAFETARNQPAA